jgi:hypothetical protein
MDQGAKRTAWAWGGLLTVVLAVIVVSSARGSFAQGDATPAGTTPTVAPTPTPPFSAALVAAAEVDVLAAGPATLSVIAVTLPGYSVTQPFTTAGPVLIRVNAGVITLDAGEATISPVVAPIGVIVPEPPAPAPADGQPVGPGLQIALPAGVQVRIGNDGAATATITVITLVGEAATTGTPAASD